ncbi:peptidase M50 [Mycobacterium sp. CVI_P3]|uniref:Peptidase M50 n=1 Tax=Mycobacterium pinniadriaticum TaxID=2994102 RepID=A0ABT3SIC0_9MYCO|nr:peptidase M50 [Mycobacterium pinniadriaticum]MCX2932737.1 peptidase M50 [Mycobacterium pinniadriaticum]MCX2939203.1 peptidase M50 [Mycobacterium pinniadriaticum]
MPVVTIGGPDDIDAATAAARRVVVLGSAADLATVLTRLMRIDRLDVEVAHASGWRGARRALTGVAQRIPLIRDETGTVVAQAAFWLPPGEDRVIHGEAVVDDDVLFDGKVTAVRIEPTTSMPGLRAAALTGRMRPRRWLTGRAVQLGTTGARVVRDGVPMPREVKRSAFYRHTTGWLRVS